MKKLIIVFLLISAAALSQNSFTVEWESPADRHYTGIYNWERNNSIPEIVCSSTNRQTVFVYDGATKQVKYSYSTPDSSTLATYAAPINRPIDVNNDGIFEIISSQYSMVGGSGIYNSKFKVLNGANGQVLYQNTFYGAIVFVATLCDIDGDGYTEVCIQVYNYPSGSNNKLVILSTTSNYVGVKDNNSQINDYELEQNYPNPFNPSTKIDFSIAKNGNVKITLFDISGREVKTILNEFRNAGSYSVIVTGENLASGTYFYQLSVDGVFETKKMILIK